MDSFCNNTSEDEVTNLNQPDSCYAHCCVQIIKNVDLCFFFLQYFLMQIAEQQKKNFGRAM